MEDAHLVRRAPDRPGSEQHPGHGRRLGRHPPAPRSRPQVLGLGRGADEPSRRGGDLRHRGLVRPHQGVAGPGPRHRLLRPAGRSRLAGVPVRHQGQPDGGLRGAPELHAGAGGRHRGGRGAELPAGPRPEQGRADREGEEPPGLRPDGHARRAQLLRSGLLEQQRGRLVEEVRPDPEGLRSRRDRRRPASWRRRPPRPAACGRRR